MKKYFITFSNDILENEKILNYPNLCILMAYIQNREIDIEEIQDTLSMIKSKKIEALAYNYQKFKYTSTDLQNYIDFDLKKMNLIKISFSKMLNKILNPQNSNKILQFYKYYYKDNILIPKNIINNLKISTEDSKKLFNGFPVYKKNIDGFSGEKCDCALILDIDSGSLDLSWNVNEKHS